MSLRIEQSFIQVDEQHKLFIEDYGSLDGVPVLFIHGGPGGGFSERDREFFDPQKFRVIFVDQRGAGRSEPAAELTNNNTWTLISDFEFIRKKLNISQWILFGGSWGSTLALAYAITHPDIVTSLILRGVFLARSQEMDWLYKEGGAGRFFPEFWQPFWEHIPRAERNDLITAYHKRLTSKDSQVQIAAAKEWSGWEGSISMMIPDTTTIANFTELQQSLKVARIECHYFVNNCFFAEANYLLNHLTRIQHLKCIVVQGRYDVVCPPESAWDLQKAWGANCQLWWAPLSGHSRRHSEVFQLLKQAIESFAPN